MFRTILDDIGLFALPFLAYAAFLLIARRNPLERAHWEPQVFRLVSAGLVIVVGSLLFAGLTATRHEDGYVPPHIENGRVVPGQFQ